ncbi:MAG TPA: zf-HC2 domain-containing protein [Gemmatimonadales bacterium]|nr:zf-HC2 domain-containing protein [Gemmatimonadales bacterium]
MTTHHPSDAEREAYLAGQLPTPEAEAFEAHAGSCEPCGAVLEAATRLSVTLPRELPPPIGIRSRVLAALPVRRRRGLRRHWWMPVAIAAGVGIAVLVLTPAKKPAQAAREAAATAALARAHAAQPLAMLDAAEAELTSALAAAPGDPGLEDALARLASQRRSLLTLVEEFES